MQRAQYAPPDEERMETQLASPPLDAVSCVRFAPSSDDLAVSSWDKSVRVHAVDAASSWPKFESAHSSPVLDVCWATDRDLLFGGLDAAVVLSRIEPKQECVLGQHSEAVSAVAVNSECRSFFSGSWDKTVMRWDSRTAVETETCQLPAEVLSMDCSGYRLAVALGCRYIFIYDIRNLQRPEQRRESALLHQTRCLRCFPDGSGFGISSVEGRVAMEWFDMDPEVQRTKKYAFKCARQPNDADLHPVNAIAFHPRHGTFATGGGDGYVHLWNGHTRKRLHQLRRFPNSITSLSFNAKGTLLAIAASYCWDDVETAAVARGWTSTPPSVQRPEKSAPDQVYIRSVTEADIKPKAGDSDLT